MGVAPFALVALMLSVCSSEQTLADVTVPEKQAARRPPPAEVKSFLDLYCLECHADPVRKGGLDLEVLTNDWGAETERAAWVHAARRLDAAEMPPRRADQPDASEAEAFVVAIARAYPGAVRERGAAVVRRLTRGEYRRAVRDLFGASVDLDDVLPADDPGNGFDTASDGLALSPLAVERFIDAAERVALAIAPSEDVLAQSLVVEGTRLHREGPGAVVDGAQMLYANGRISASWRANAPGRYRIRVESWGQQAGPETVRLAIRVEGRRTLSTFEVPNTRDDPLSTEVIAEVSKGANRVDVVFLNDYWRPDDPDPQQRDRNAAVRSIEINGPLELPPLPPIVRDAIGAAEETVSTRSFVESVTQRAFRRPVGADEVNELLAVAGPDASPRSRLLGAITAILASPSFLIRADGALPPGYGAASRLASFLWSSVPDEALLDAAASGALNSGGERGRAARAMLDDPRSRALAEEFATQWLAVRELTRRMPDPARYPSVDGALIESMREETIRWFDSILRGGRPVHELLDSEWTVANDQLLRHYGLDEKASLETPDQNGWRRVRVDSGGLLRHASILLATSNPTRTSPVKRGRFVLDALLDEPPPPPPPGVAQLPPEADDPDASLASMMERHRADPACASCHRSMDSIGLLLERYDAVGRVRDVAATSAELPDGRRVEGVEQLHDALLEDGALARTLGRRMLVYATGRSLSRRERDECDLAIDQLGADATLRDLVVRIVELDAFLPTQGASPP